MNVETIKIEADNEQGFIIINKSDFNGSHKEYSEDKPKAQKNKKKSK